MIQLPRRSVTRFFIPLIDVLTLLFCIFLLLPLVQPTPESDAASGKNTIPNVAGPDAQAANPSQEALKTEVERQRAELKRLQEAKIEALQSRLTIRVLEIDADTGKLYYQEPEQRVEITSQAEARALIERQKREAGGRELYYLFLYPRRVTGYPEQQQIARYEHWFEGVAHGIDNPRGSR
jgi:hypothetical protein